MEPEQLLFINVIIQAIEDTLSTKKDIEERIAKSQAKAWFKANAADYKEVCLHAQIDAAWLRKTVLTADIKKLRKLINEYRTLD